MSNHQVSSQYTHTPDLLSLEGLDDFLCGLIDELFHVEAEGPQENSSRAELALIESDIIDDIENNDRGNVVSALPGLFARSAAAAKSIDERPSLFEGDADTNQWLLRVKLLESQLDYRTNELQESLRRMRWLENELASREDQVKYLPELLKRSVDATRYELELDDLKLKLEFLTSELSSANEQLATIKANWLGRLSLWLASKKADMERTEQPICEASD